MLDAGVLIHQRKAYLRWHSVVLVLNSSPKQPAIYIKEAFRNSGREGCGIEYDLIKGQSAWDIGWTYIRCRCILVNGRYDHLPSAQSPRSPPVDLL